MLLWLGSSVNLRVVLRVFICLFGVLMICVAQLRSGMIRVAEKHLSEQQFENYAPRIRDESGRLVPMMPRYIFVRVGDSCASDWRAVNGTRGVEKLLPVHLERPSALPEGYLEDLRDQVSRMQTLESAIEVSRAYAPGDRVEILCGPYAGFVGTFEEKRRGMVRLVMGLLGRNSVVYTPLQNTAAARVQ